MHSVTDPDGQTLRLDADGRRVLEDRLREAGWHLAPLATEPYPLVELWQQLDWAGLRRVALTIARRAERIWHARYPDDRLIAKLIAAASAWQPGDDRAPLDRAHSRALRCVRDQQSAMSELIGGVLAGHLQDEAYHSGLRVANAGRAVLGACLVGSTASDDAIRALRDASRRYHVARRGDLEDETAALWELLVLTLETCLQAGAPTRA